MSFRPEGRHPDAPFHCVDGVAAAIGKARELTGEGRDVGVAAGDVGGQAFALGAPVRPSRQLTEFTYNPYVPTQVS